MSDYVESRWETKGEPTTTAYGAHNSGFNEFGHRLPPKPVHNLHGVRVSGRWPVSQSTIAELVTDFHRIHGRMPTALHVTGPKQSDKFLGFPVPLLGFVGLNVQYEAERVHVA